MGFQVFDPVEIIRDVLFQSWSREDEKASVNRERCEVANTRDIVVKMQVDLLLLAVLWKETPVSVREQVFDRRADDQNLAIKIRSSEPGVEPPVDHGDAFDVPLFPAELGHFGRVFLVPARNRGNRGQHVSQPPRPLDRRLPAVADLLRTLQT